MRLRPLRLIFAALLLAAAARADAEVFVRWDRDRVPPQAALGIPTLVVPLANQGLVRSARRAGYRVLVEADAARVATMTSVAGLAGVVITGPVTAAQRQAAERRLLPQGLRVLTVDERAKWPHIRTNWVTRNNDVLQVTSRSAQPWIENNAALIRVGQTGGGAPALTYAWVPQNVSDSNAVPGVEDYLVAIAEAGSFGADLVLPLDAKLQDDLLLALPRARTDWAEIRRYAEFYSWEGARARKPRANVAALAADPMRWFEVLNLLLRHNLPVEAFTPSAVPGLDGGRFDLVVVFDPMPQALWTKLSAFVEGGGTLIVGPDAQTGVTGAPWRTNPAAAGNGDGATYRHGKGVVIERKDPIADPNAFALDVRQALGRDRRVVDIWNGITMLIEPFESPDGGMLLTIVNYTGQPLPAQLRVRGAFAEAVFETPESGSSLLPVERRDGFTELVLPSLRVGGRIFLTPAR